MQVKNPPKLFFIKINNIFSTIMQYCVLAAFFSVFSATAARTESAELKEVMLTDPSYGLEKNKIDAGAPEQTGKTITGTVKDVHGQPIIGANIIEEDASSNGTVTDIDGKFTLQVGNNATVRISYIGYLPQTIHSTERTHFDITLIEDTRALEEIVITAMGIKRERKALGYAVSDLDAGELMKNKNTNVVNSLAGKIPGVNITQSSGAAGAGANIIISNTFGANRYKILLSAEETPHQKVARINHCSWLMVLFMITQPQWSEIVLPTG